MGRPVVQYRDTLRLAVKKTAEPIEMLFGLWVRIGPRNHVLDGVTPDPSWEGGNFKGEKRWPVVKCSDFLP